MDHNRKSMMEPAEGSRETAVENERLSSESGRMSGEDMRNRESPSDDLGSSSDRAMMTGRSSEGRDMPAGDLDSATSSDMSSERGRGNAGERNAGGTENRGRTGGITNRGLDREQSEQDQLPGRGRSQTER
ncbi:hypothetical protein D3C83_09610 [compost metagenome]